MALYDLDDVRAALGIARGVRIRSPSDAFSGDQEEIVNLPDATEHQARIGAILAAGEDGRWRKALGPTSEADGAVAQLAARAPHLEEFTKLVRTNLRAALNMAVPTFLDPVLLVGEPGVGKTWYLSRLGGILGLPFRTYPMSSSTLGEGLSGSHPSWRNASPGLVAKTLLREPVANPLVFVDEFDKVQRHVQNGDPYRPFYALLDPSGSRSFVDEYLGFGLDASKLLWVMAANDTTMIPDAILDRLTVMDVPEMTPEHRLAVAESIYAEANSARRSFFEPILARPVLECLALLRPRSVRVAVEHAMALAAADGRRAVAKGDIRFRPQRAGTKIGFRQV